MILSYFMRYWMYVITTVSKAQNETTDETKGFESFNSPSHRTSRARLVIEIERREWKWEWKWKWESSLFLCLVTVINLDSLFLGSADSLTDWNDETLLDKRYSWPLLKIQILLDKFIISLNLFYQICPSILKIKLYYLYIL